ncbi:MAG: PQQ-binding-like beta-propeller repeat protein [Verrucomicrobiaceae bacterium]|nr:PQQ-binding-like beta-propeller repeat protein [Verrucomicrobiaceae bacterium]
MGKNGRKLMHGYLWLLGLSLSLVSSAIGEVHWPQFRGAGAMGVADHPELPEEWDKQRNVSWKVAVEGMGWSCPCVWGERIYITTAVNSGATEKIKEGLYFGGERPAPKDTHEWRVVCLDLKTGKTLWSRTVHRGVPSQARHLKNSYASETPVTDGERVYAYFGNVGLFTFDMDGNGIWEYRWKAVKTRHGWGTAASPFLHEGRIYVINDNDEQSFLAALDKKSGAVIWSKNRDEPSNWSPPFVWKNSQRTEIITPGTGMTRSYDLDGNVLWTLRGLSSITVPSPFASGDLLYLCSGYVGDKRKPLFAIKPGAKGDITLDPDETHNKFIAWCQKKAAPYMPTPLLYRGRVYVLLDRGLLSCYEAKTGRVIYDRERLGKSAKFTASPLAYNGRIFCFGERGETVVVDAGDSFRMTGRNELDDLIMSTPAIAGDSLIVRTLHHLYCIRKSGS